MARSLRFWLSLGLLGMLAGAVRVLAVVVLPIGNWESRETRMQSALIALGIAALALLGLFPQTSNFLIKDLPALFQNLGR